MTEKYVTFKNRKGEQIVGILREADSEVGLFTMTSAAWHPLSTPLIPSACAGCNAKPQHWSARC